MQVDPKKRWRIRTIPWFQQSNLLQKHIRKGLLLGSCIQSLQVFSGYDQHEDNLHGNLPKNPRSHMPTKIFEDKKSPGT